MTTAAKATCRKRRADTSSPRAAVTGVSTRATVAGSLRGENDAGAGLDDADPAEEEPVSGELGLETETTLRRQRHEQPARRLRVVREADELLRHARLDGHVRPGELLV